MLVQPVVECATEDQISPGFLQPLRLLEIGVLRAIWVKMCQVMSHLKNNTEWLN